MIIIHVFLMFGLKLYLFFNLEHLKSSDSFPNQVFTSLNYEIQKIYQKLKKYTTV